MLPPIDTGATVERRPRTRRESARLSFTGILSELRALELGLYFLATAAMALWGGSSPFPSMPQAGNQALASNQPLYRAALAGHTGHAFDIGARGV